MEIRSTDQCAEDVKQLVETLRNVTKDCQEHASHWDLMC